MAVAKKASKAKSAGNAEWLARRNLAVVRGIGHSTGVFTARARNAEIWDVEGKTFEFRRVRYDIKGAQRAIRKAKLPERFALRLESGR